MADTKTSEKYKGAYLERSGEDSRQMAETLVTQPEFPLDEAQLAEAREFEKFIYSSELEFGQTIDDIIRIHRSETTTAPRFFAEAFMKGKIDFSEVDVTSLDLSTPQDVYVWVSKNALESTIDEATLSRMAKESASFYKQSVADLIVSGETPDPVTMDNMAIVIDPAEALRMSKSVIQARQFLHVLRGEYKEGGDNLQGAKRALIDVYLRRINGLAVSDVTTMDHLAEQSNLISDPDTACATSEVIPLVLRDALVINRPQTLKRLDYVRNGIGKDKAGRATAVDDSVIQGNEREEAEEKNEHPLFSAEQLERFKKFKLSPKEMVDFYGQVLQKAGLLSSEDPKTWYPTRKHRAADDLFQVVENPSGDTFGVDGANGAYRSASKERSLDEVILVGFHELEHVNQSQIDRLLGKQIHIAELRGKRIGMLREGGANFKQRQAGRELFGISKPISLAYARALETLEDGGDAFEATRSFYAEELRCNPGADPSILANKAADRVLRLTNHGGINSQPMAYAEESILDQELKHATPEVKARVVAVTSLDLVDQVSLHKYGLLSSIQDHEIDWTEIILKTAEPYIVKALA